MKTYSVFACRLIALTAFVLFLSAYSFGQNSSKSLLINHGGDACGSTAAKQHFFAGTLTSSPTLIASCNVGVPYHDVMAAYNPADHKIYFAQKAGSTTKVFALDFNLSGAITCPSAPTPTYTYGYMLDQLCFDNEGNNYVIYNFKNSTATATIAQVDITTGIEKPGTAKTIRFPAGNVPNSVQFGDIILLPNGRMFMTFGNSPSKLFELTNLYGSGDATASFLTDIPRQCFSIGYVDGNLIIAGSDGGGCYYYKWDINSFALSTASTFPLGKNSSDMSNMTVGVGTANELMGASAITASSSVLYYDVVLKNKGNISLSNVQLVDDLVATFGAGNVSNVQISFVHNPANLILNTSYDGSTDINLLQSGQILGNSPSSSDSVVIRIQLTAKNLVSGHVYYNSAIGSGQIGTGTNYLAVSDSSNNGRSNVIDIDGNGVSDDAGENVPTPYAFGTILANNPLSLKAVEKAGAYTLTWNNLEDIKATKYKLQRSYNGRDFSAIAHFTSSKTDFSYTDNSIATGTVYYQVMITKTNGQTVYSNIVSFKNKSALQILAWPNPSHSDLTISFNAATSNNATIRISDAMGKKMIQKNHFAQKGKNSLTLEVGKLNPGIYLCEVLVNNQKEIIKIIRQ